MLLRLILLSAVVCLMAPGAQAQLVVGSDITGATIYHIDINTSMATPLYTGGAEAETWGMAYDHDTNTLYWNNGTTLYRSPFSMGGLTPTMVGTITYQGASASFVALAYRNGRLLGTRNIATEAVYEIDPVSAVATLIYQYPSTFDFGGIGVDATTTLLFGVNDATGAPSGRGLYEIDTNAQTTTFRAPYPGGETDIDGLAAYDGLAYYVIDQPGLFYIYDIATGNQVGTLPSPFTGSAIFSAAAFVPGGPVSIEDDTWGHIKGLYR
jgi:hypothetical protein